MPTIDVYPDVPRAYNRVEINWADTPSVTHARVLRVDVETGECTPLRPHLCYIGDYQLLSCGHAIFFDTEVPLDRSVYYITEAFSGSPCLPAEGPFVFDNFNRIVNPNWGFTDSGQAWTPIIPAGASAQVNGTQGLATVDSADETIFMSIPVSEASYSGAIQFFTTEVATGSVLVWELDIRYADDNNYHFVQVLPNTDNSLICRVGSRVAGVTNFIQATGVTTYAINTAVNVEWEMDGTTLRLQAWSSPSPRPVGWLIESTNTAISAAGDLRVRIGTSLGNTNAPVTQSVDNLSLTALCPPCIPVTVESEPSTMASNGAFRLKDPVRPCHDIYMPLCFDQTNPARIRDLGQYCAPGTGVFFASMETETYDSNSLTVNPTNARRPIALTRQRRDVASDLIVVTRTFTDRDNLLKLVNPGSPILLQGPPQYGIPDRYMDVGTVGIDRGLTDHRFQVRIVQLPHATVDRPAGPQQGVCGSQVDDLCEFTWQELADDGNTWEDLVRGRPTGGVSGYRTWDDVLTEFADWDDVNNGTRTWFDLEVGD